MTPREQAERQSRRAYRQLSANERAQRGKAAREWAPRSSHARWEPAVNRPDPLALLEQQGATRLKELLPLRYERMAQSPLAFFRGAACVMASDIADTPVSGIEVQACGDAHLENFGAFGSPERSLVFDVNDFDETLPGPWEWDVKRLAASIALAGRQRGFSDTQRRQIVTAAVHEYRRAMRRFATMPTIAIWYARIDEHELRPHIANHFGAAEGKRFDRSVARAKLKDSSRAFSKLAHCVNGTARLVADPPLLVPIADLLPDTDRGELERGIRSLLDGYSTTLAPDRRRLLEGYRFADAARKVVGVGSVGTRSWILLLLGRDANDPLFLQLKEAQPSVLEPYVDPSKLENHGQRVVEGQRLMQAASDLFLGWTRTKTIDGTQRDFYVRQLWDWKSSADIDHMSPEGLSIYTRLCAWTLARAHARSGDRIAIAAYLGSASKFEHALASFAEDYADQTARDHSTLLDAIATGQLAESRGAAERVHAGVE